MQDSDQIIILPKELASVGRKQYALVEQESADEADEEVEFQTSVSLARKGGEAERKELRCRRLVSFVVFVVLVGAVTYMQYQITTTDKEPLSQGNQEIIEEDNTSTLNTTIKDETQLQEEENGTAKVDQSNLKKINHKTINKTTRTPEFIPVPNEFEFNNTVLHRPANQHELHSPQTFPYPTLGMREPGQVFNRTCKLARYGDKQDGGYLLCNNFLNHSQALINLGVEGRDLFGCDVSTAALIPNYQYDCTNNNAPKCTTNGGLNHFQPACLGERTEKSEGNQFYSLKAMVDSRNLNKRHVCMKIDVEGAEWPGLRAFPYEYLDYIDQFVFQIHLQSGTISYQPVWGNLDILNSLAQKFASVSLHMNNHACIERYNGAEKNRYYPSFAIQVTLVNRDLLTIFDQTRSYWLHPQHRPNRFGEDCQLHD